MQHLPPPTHEQMMQQQIPPEHFQQQQEPPPQHPQHQPPPAHGQAMGHAPPPPIMGHPGPIVAHPSTFPYVYSSPMDVAARGMQPATPGPPQTWQAANGIAPSQTHLAPPAPTHIAPPPHAAPAPPPQPEHHIMDRQQGYTEEQAWNGGYHAMQQPPPGMVPGPPPPGYEYRYRDDQTAGWVPAPETYYPQHVRYTCRSIRLSCFTEECTSTNNHTQSQRISIWKTLDLRVHLRSHRCPHRHRHRHQDLHQPPSLLRG